MKQETIATFLLRRLKEIGCDHIFGVPGDFILAFLNIIDASGPKYIGTCNELNAAYAADGYARIKGIGCVCTTFSVGELSALNGVSGSYAESVPVIHITGVPSRYSLKTKPLLHHSLKSNFQASLTMFKEITVKQVLLDCEKTAVEDIDGVLLACLEKQSPVYIRIPADMVNHVILAPETSFVFPSPKKSNICSLNDAIHDVTQLICAATFPMLIPGIEIARRNLHQEFVALTETFNIPFATLPMSKAIVDEDNPQFVGLYYGSISREDLRTLMRQVDCLIIIGEVLSDFNTGGFSTDFSRSTTVELSYDHVQVKHRVYSNVYIHDILPGLFEALKEKGYYNKTKFLQLKEACTHKCRLDYKAEFNKPLTISRFFDRLGTVIQSNSIVLVETGVSSFAAVEVSMPKKVTYISQVYYGSIGYTLGATLGACLAAPHRPIFLLIGDGSFQVVCQELSSIIRYQKTGSQQNYIPPTVFLINNQGYTIERKIEDGPINNIQPWFYHQLPHVFGAPQGCSFCVQTEEQLEQVLSVSPQQSGFPLLFIELCFDKYDCTRLLELTGKACKEKNRGLVKTERFSAFLDE